MNASHPDGGMRQLLEAMRSPAPTRFASLVGLCIGAIGGALYWLAAQLWPSSIALSMSLLVVGFLTTELRLAAALKLDVLSQIFYVLLKYNALMALSAAKLPFPAPANFAVPLVMFCAYGASRALLVSMFASIPSPANLGISIPDLALALCIGFGPALLLGVPGLVGLAVAIVASMGFTSYLKFSQQANRYGMTAIAPLLTEVSFYLGAQASWSYVN
jgi:hypothetical protein